MPLLGKAVLAVWSEVEPNAEADFDQWYVREHLPERTLVPGLTRGRRYRADAGSPRSMAFYEATSMEVLTTGEYRRQLDNPSAWTKRILPTFRFSQRGLCDVAASVGDGIGAAAAVLHLTPGDATTLRGWTTQTLFPDLMASPHVTAAHLWTLSPGEPGSPTSALNRHVARPVNWVVVVETMDATGAAAVTDLVLDRDPKAHGATEIQAYPAYQLLYALDRR